ncbi:YncE family protein [Sphingobacterium griseoflavum]|uniref:Lipoprotein n=1 Tax=Sphingobacterium griseoflavum TaxID=1474952 RepID=A0ABQ3HQJ6_9SPHI|nr:hypothetical protein [Sphingobacterium griseoflavum]GHE23394.1 hypothetical protein GCM10017764_03620 [Sphingobacterium griseoflavum]
MKYCFFAFVAMIVFAASCSEEEKEPVGRINTISRLYVSFEEYESSNDGIADTNIRISTNADSAIFVLDTAHLSMARGGGVLLFNPFLKSIIQASANPEDQQRDSAIYISQVQLQGQLTNGAMMASPFLRKVRGLAYHRASDALFIVNADANRSGIFVVDRPNSINQNRKPWKQFFTGDLPMWGAAYHNNRLFVAKQGEAGGIYVFEGVATRPVNVADSTANLSPARVLSIENATNLHGMAYDTTRNMLAITDFGDGTTNGTGRILIFENFNSMIAGASITPTRIITGAATLLTKPVDVAIDPRATGRYLYVADKSKKVLRFLITDNGNVSPNQVILTDTLGTPVALALDSRDDSTLPQF